MITLRTLFYLFCAHLRRPLSTERCRPLQLPSVLFRYECKCPELWPSWLSTENIINCFQKTPDYHRTWYVSSVSVSYKNLFLLTSSVKNSPELVQIFHLRLLQSSLKSALFPVEYLSSHFLVILQRGSFILQCSLGDLCIKSKYIKANTWPQHSAKDSATEKLQANVMI